MLHEDFLAELRQRNLSLLRWSAIIFNPIYVAWSGVDYLLVPAHWTQLFWYRIACVLLTTLIVVIAHRPSCHRFSHAGFALFLIAFGGFLIPVLTVGGPAFLAYALGYTLVIMGAGTIPSWTWTWSVGTITALTALAALGFGLGDVDRQNILAAASFVVTASAISITASLFKTHVLRRDFEMRAKLESMTKELTGANQELLRLSSTDPLTGLLNRRSLMERLDLETARALRYQRALSVLVLDIDHFKKINDTLGHEAGDEALVRLATIVRSGIRGSDLAARLGGEEFVVIAPETTIDGARVLAERLRTEIQLGASYTVSIGVASTESKAARTSRELLALADCALYRAKGAGRNCVVVDQPKFQPPLTTTLAPEM